MKNEIIKSFSNKLTEQFGNTNALLINDGIKLILELKISYKQGKFQ